MVASSGTSLTEGQIRLIKRYSDNVTVLYDGDAAGIKASLRGTDLLLEGGLNVRVVLFPDGDDPDSYIRKVGDQRFAEYIETKSQDFITFKTTLVAREASNDPVKKAEAIRDVLHSIAKVPDAIKRQVFLQQTSATFGIDEQVLITEYNKLVKVARAKRRRTAATTGGNYGQRRRQRQHRLPAQRQPALGPGPAPDDRRGRGRNADVRRRRSRRRNPGRRRFLPAAAKATPRRGRPRPTCCRCASARCCACWCCTRAAKLSPK